MRARASRLPARVSYYAGASLSTRAGVSDTQEAPVQLDGNPDHGITARPATPLGPITYPGVVRGALRQ